MLQTLLFNSARLSQSALWSKECVLQLCGLFSSTYLIKYLSGARITSEMYHHASPNSVAWFFNVSLLCTAHFLYLLSSLEQWTRKHFQQVWTVLGNILYFVLNYTKSVHATYLVLQSLLVWLMKITRRIKINMGLLNSIQNGHGILLMWQNFPLFLVQH